MITRTLVVLALIAWVIALAGLVGAWQRRRDGLNARDPMAAPHGDVPARWPPAQTRSLSRYGEF